MGGREIAKGSGRLIGTERDCRCVEIAREILKHRRQWVQCEVVLTWPKLRWVNGEKLPRIEGTANGVDYVIVRIDWQAVTACCTETDRDTISSIAARVGNQTFKSWLHWQQKKLLLLCKCWQLQFVQSYGSSINLIYTYLMITIELQRFCRFLRKAWRSIHLTGFKAAETCFEFVTIIIVRLEDGGSMFHSICLQVHTAI